MNEKLKVIILKKKALVNPPPDIEVDCPNCKSFLIFKWTGKAIKYCGFCGHEFEIPY